jgi:hypothetical protein
MEDDGCRTCHKALQTQWGVYLVGRPGTSGTTGCIIYTFFVFASSHQIEEFVASPAAKFHGVMQHFYTSYQLKN